MQPASQGSRHSNRLAGESSPYLLQHAANPVDWWPWGEGAFAEARRRGVPIFLSIGYSTCYWCHVMERESFESGAIAALLNERFVCVKVDREERPDVDDIYMAATQIMTGRGGWPMTCFLEPESLRPFWCGTYFPPEPRMGMAGLPQILEGIAHAWGNRREEVVAQAAAVAASVGEQMASAEAPVGVGLAQVSEAARALLRMFDRTEGGFGSAPKFPQPVFLEFLLDVRESAGDEATRDAVDQAVRLTLDKMACGGMNDQVGGGFHRYSVDEKWLVPHFEKMLYDNAQLASLYARASALYADEFYARTARRTLDYVLREMAQTGGGFSSAQDAEVDGREGGNYVWHPAEIRGALEGSDAAFAMSVYGLDDGPNFKDPHHPEAAAANVLRLSERPERLAGGLGASGAEVLGRLDRVNAALYAARARRPQPRLDDKVIAGWNGMMIAALARAGLALQERRYVEAGARAADFVLASMRDSRGGLLRVWRDGKAGTSAFLEDYACMIDGLLALRAADAATGWLQGGLAGPAALAQARSLAGRVLEEFGDSRRGGFFDARQGQGDLFIRPRTTHDGAMPAGASVMIHNLLELHEITGEGGYLEGALGGVRSVSAAIAGSPVSATNSTRAVLRMIAAGTATAERLAAMGPAPEIDEPGAGAGFTPVEVYSSEERIGVGKDRPAQLTLVLRIKEGYHLTAADPGPGGKGLIPVRVGVVHGGGVAVYADYPAGEPYGRDGELRVYRGSVEFPVAVERTGEWSGRPIISVTFQACTESECLAPVTAELDVAIDDLD